MKKRLTNEIPMDIKQYIPSWLLDQPREPSVSSVDIPDVNVPPEAPVVFRVAGQPEEPAPAKTKARPRKIKSMEVPDTGFDRETFRLHLLTEGVSEVRARQTANRAAQAFGKAGINTFAVPGQADAHPGLADYSQQSRMQVIKAARRAYKWLEGMPKAA